jgi:HEPN domain-containing protein
MKSACPYRLIAYHAQQCAEKCIKAYLVYHSIDFPYTHNIKTLLKLCGKNADWAAALKDAEELTPYAITARYPGEDEEVTKQEAKKAIKTASSVRQTIRKVLGQHGL